MRALIVALLLVGAACNKAGNNGVVSADLPEVQRVDPVPAPAPPAKQDKEALYAECRDRVENPQQAGECTVDADCDPDETCSNSIKSRNDKFAIFLYRQEMETDNLPVHGSLVKIPVLLGSTEKIGHIGINLVDPPESPLPGDVISTSDAIAVVQQSADYGHLTTFTPPAEAVKP